MADALGCSLFLGRDFETRAHRPVLCDIYLGTEQTHMFNPLLLIFLGQNLLLVSGNVELAGVGLAYYITSTL